VTGKVTGLEPFGAFIELEPGLDGLIHVADLSFERIEHAKDVLKLEQQVDVLIHHLDVRSKKVGLHLAPPADRPEEAPQRIAKGNSVKVEVVKADTAGVVVRILGITGRGARGFIPAGQTSTQRGTDLRKHFKVGSQLEVKVIDVDPKRGEPKLSIKGLFEDEERRATKEYRSKLKAEANFGTLGDLFAKRLQK
jgi:small subunit ribosomal protein S1